jgi:ketosteroid isomerase-like protein
MKAVIIPLALALTASGAVGQAVPESALPSVTLPASLDRVLRDYERAWAAGSAADLAALFTEDGFVLSNGNTPVRGREAIRERYANAGGALRLRALAYATADTVGYIVGAYGYGDEAGSPDNGKFVLALRRGADGRWLIAADIDNTNRRRPAEP